MAATVDNDRVHHRVMLHRLFGVGVIGYSYRCILVALGEALRGDDGSAEVGAGLFVGVGEVLLDVSVAEDVIPRAAFRLVVVVLRALLL